MKLFEVYAIYLYIQYKGFYEFIIFENCITWFISLMGGKGLELFLFNSGDSIHIFDIQFDPGMVCEWPESHV